MSIEFILGNVINARDEYIESKIAHLIKQNVFENVLVIVPPHLTFFYESTLLNNLNLKGSFGISVQSPSRIADTILSTVYGKAIKGIDAMGKNFLIRYILNQHIKDFKALNLCATKANMATQIGDLIKEFKMLDVTPDMLKLEEYPNENTKNKIEDIVLIYEKYLQATKDLPDNEEKFNLAIDYIKDWEYLKDAHVFVTGFENFDAQRTRFLKEVMSTAKNTTVGFLYEKPTSKNAYIYEICNVSREKLIAHGKNYEFCSKIIEEPREIDEDIKNAANNIFAYPFEKVGKCNNISITYAKNKEEEVRCIAAQIAYFHEKLNYKFSDFVIVLGTDESYKFYVNKIFQKANIPVFTGEKRVLVDNSFVRYVLFLLEFTSGKIKKDSVISFGKTGFINNIDMDSLENYAYTHFKDGFSFLKPVEDENIEPSRKNLCDVITNLRKKAYKKIKARELIDVIVEEIKNSKAIDTLEKSINEMYKNDFVKSGEYTAQIYDKTLKILMQAKDILGEEKIPKSVLLRILKDTFESVNINVIPPLVDEVQMMEISALGIKDFKVLFLIGVNEAKLPDFSKNDDVLSEWQREFVLKEGAGIKHVTKIEKQKLSILKAFASPTSKLYLSCVVNNSELPSTLINRIKEVFPNIKINQGEKIANLLEENVYEKAAQTLKKISRGTKTSEKDKNIAANFMGQEKSRGAFILKSIENSNKATRLHKDISSLLYRELKGSASRVENFYACPYKHFMSYGIKPKIHKEYVLSFLEMGNYVHDTLDICFNQPSLKNISNEEFTEIVENSKKIAKEKNEKYRGCKQNENIILAMDREIDVCTQVIKNQLSAGSFEPCATEYNFVQNFENISISGKIDRVDYARIDNKEYIFVVDYKTGDKDFSINKLFFGLNTQLAVYIMAARELFKTSNIIGANYFHVHIPFFEIPTSIDSDYTMKGITHLNCEDAQKLFGIRDKNLYSLNLKLTKSGDFDSISRGKNFTKEELDILLLYTKKLVKDGVERIIAGDTEILPVEDKEKRTCQWCDYSSICMFDKETNKVIEISNEGKEEVLKKMQKEME